VRDYARHHATPQERYWREPANEGAENYACDFSSRDFNTYSHSREERRHNERCDDECDAQEN